MTLKEHDVPGAISPKKKQQQQLACLVKVVARLVSPNNPINERALSLGPRLSHFSKGSCKRTRLINYYLIRNHHKVLPFGLREALDCFFSLRSYKGKFVKTKRIRAKVSYKTKDTTDFL